MERGAAFERKVHDDAVARQHREAARRKKHVLRAAEEARAAEHATASVAPCTVAERSVLWRRIDAVVARYRAANRRALALLPRARRAAQRPPDGAAAPKAAFASAFV